MPPSPKLGLGTVQFGVSYGVSNTAGQTSPQDAAAVLRLAARAGIRVLDTAAGYGTSEAVLGESLPAGDWRIVTKTAALKSPADVAAGLAESLRRLRRPSVEGLLVHQADDLLGPEGPGVYRELLRAKEGGLTRLVGASVYTSAQIDALLARYRLDLVQVPLNVLDQRLIADGRLAKLKDRGVEVHARSAFLQGALLMAPDDLPPFLAAARPRFERFRAQAAAHGLSPLEASLAFVLGVPEVDVAVVGVEGPEHFGEVLEASELRVAPKDWASCAVSEESVVNPALWKGRAGAAR